ncbi:sugar phosphate isomerase/epimerase family protein [Salsuginibacillus kocurii]|uniref:sugar phosphate isomerase/epimerase family protein n=1 Tax=Salsuginibacillus kocurii TaxID=427078 RepID=UPI00036BD504|nr:sugar phosphate isomerase/epimerase [Salsuginibacillus kocurii]
MKLGVFTVLYSHLSLEQLAKKLKTYGLEAVELGTGGYPGHSHCDPDLLLEDTDQFALFKKTLEENDLTISALSCHGNPLHPQKSIAEKDHELFLKTVKLAEKLEVPVVNTFSGCPGDHENAKYPNWPVAPWPNDYQEILDWQWKEKVIPYWKEAEAYASAHGVKIGLELHGGFSVHSPATLLRLREATGDALGANLDPSHMWWQGIDPVQAIRILGEANALHHFHAKDATIDPVNIHKHGITDMQTYDKMLDRAWQFRTVGYGHDSKVWADIISTLRLVGYDDAISIEHEDGLMSVDEGFSKAVNHLQPLLMREPMGDMWWV